MSCGPSLTPPDGFAVILISAVVGAIADSIHDLTSRAIPNPGFRD
jgi:hypothetical protein